MQVLQAMLRAREKRGKDYKVFAGIEMCRWEKLAITAKHSVQLEEEIAPSISRTFSGREEEDSINP